MKSRTLLPKRWVSLLLVSGVILAGFICWPEPPLSSDEALLVGDWRHTSATRPFGTFSADRRFVSSNGQFVGEWTIEDGVFTLTSRQTFEAPGWSVSEAVYSIRRIQSEKQVHEITFSKDGQSCTLVRNRGFPTEKSFQLLRHQAD